MKKKFKLFATIGSLALAVCMMTIGVLAASSVTFHVNSSVNFTTTSVLVDITASVTGAVEGDKNYAGFTSDAADPNKAVSAFEVGALTFDETHDEIVYTITIKNNSEFAIKMEVTGVPTPTAQLGVEEVTTQVASIEPTQSGTYTLTLSLLDFSTSFDAAETVNLTATISAA